MAERFCCKKKRIKNKRRKNETNYQFGRVMYIYVTVWLVSRGAHFYYGNSLQSAALMIFISFPGLAGLYFSTKIKSAKVRWMLLVINYLFATYFNVFQFLFILFQTF